MTMTTEGGQPSRRAVFLDRDGTINVEVDYLDDPARCLLLPHAGEAVARLNRAGFLVIVVTNQAGVGRGKFSIDAIGPVHARIDELLAPLNAHIDAYYFCPHHPDDRCRCRKPLPGLIRDAATAHSIDLARSYMVGDKRSDIEAGIAAGCATGLVLTGYGPSQLEECRRSEVRPSFIADDLAEAVASILAASDP